MPMFSHKHIPHALYELLPYLYIGMGTMVVVLLPNVFGLFSGLLLLATGIWVWWARRTYRSAWHPSEAPGARDTTPLALDRDTGLVQLVWNPEYECGHVTIDTQHRKLFEIGNTLLNAILDEKPKLDVELLLEELIRDVALHFRTEENVLAETNRPLTRAHQENHRKLLSDCKAMAERYHRNEIKAGTLFKFLAHDVVSGHILKEDFKPLAAAA